MRSLILAVGALVLAPAVWSADSLAGVGNFHQLNERVYRGAQPSAAGIQALAKLGVGTVIDLREAGRRSSTEERRVRAAGMRYLNVPMSGLAAPTPEQVERVLAVLRDESSGPVFVHCRRGADRTGTVIACYRIVHDGWENARALKEARAMGMSPIERAMMGFISRYRPAQAAVVSPQLHIP